MIINKITKDYTEVMNKPVENWTGDNESYFVVDSNSELAEKIRENHPYFEFVLDDNGNLIDVIPTEQPPAPEVMTLEEITAALNALAGGEV